MGEIGHLLHAVRRAGEGDEVQVSDILSSAGERSLAPALLIPALVVVTPLSGIPGLSSLMGLTIALISLQLLVHRKHLWLPAWLMRREVSRRRLHSALDWIEKPVGFIDRITARRWHVLVRPPVASLLELTCLICGLAMPLLEFVPFTSSILGAAVCVMAIALVTGDGLFASIGGGLIIAAAVAGYNLAERI